MAELTDARFAVAAARAAREVALRGMNDADAQANRWREEDGSFQVVDPGLNPEIFAIIQGLQPALDAASATLAAAKAAYDQAAAAYDALAGVAPLFPTDNLDPVLLLPVRLEAIYATNDDGAPELRIRVYPDDVHVDSHEPALTEGERLAGMAYWRAVSAAGDDKQGRAAAWHTLVGAIGGERAVWVREVLSPTPGEGGPVFPEVAGRTEAWTRAAQTLLLPDRLEFTAYRDGALVWRHVGADIPDSLPLGVTPPAPEEDAEPDGLPFDPGSRWLAHFPDAVTVGMGLAVPLSDPAERFDLITVVGVGGQDGATGASRVQEALAAHSFSGGLSSLPVGTPTNNTPATRSGWRSRGVPQDPDAIAGWRAAYDPASAQEAARLARALGVDGQPVLAAACDPARDDEAVLAKLHRLQADTFAWSPVWRQASEEPPEWGPFTEPWYAAASDWFAAHVRSRGTLPPLRIGRQPYGVLAASSLDLWRATEADEQVAWHIGSFEAAFAEHVDRAVQVGEGADQDAVLLDLLSREASPRRVTEWLHSIGIMDGPPPPAAVGSIPPTLSLAWQQTSRPDPDAEEPTKPAQIEPFPDTIPAELREFLNMRPLAQLFALFDEALERMRQERVGPVPDEFTALYAPIAETLWQLGQPPTLSLFYDQAEWMYNGLRNTISSQPVLPDAVDRAVIQAQSMRSLFSGYVDLEDEAVADICRVERLFRETLEPLSHRVDAWVSSLSTQRLAQLRADRPAGIRTGAYGWLTDVEATDPNPPREGFVVTPSLHHATTAAVLRSGWQAHSDRGAFAVDIQSARVRRAQATIDGVRAGQTVGALLGYQFERALHDAHLDRFVAGFRAAYPLAPVVEPEAPDQQEARISTGARNVVDGQALRRDRTALDDDAALAAAAGSDLGADAPVLRRMLAELDETFDAVGDLLLAESVHQLVGGSPLRAGLAADAVGRGQDLPTDYDVLRTPRGGIAITHHVGVLLPAALAPGWADDRPLARLEPGLEGWVRRRLGAASKWKVGPDLGDLGWCALDLLVAPVEAVRAALADRGQVDAEAFDRLMLLCERLRSALSGAVPLSVSHLDRGAASVSSGFDLAELAGRVRPWLAKVRDAAATLSAADSPEAAEPVLAELGALGLPVGAGGAGGELDRIKGLLAETKLEELPQPPDPATDPVAADQWLFAVQAVTSDLLHPAVKVSPRLTVDLPPTPAPEPAPDEVGDWLRDVSLVRPGVDALDGALVASEVLAGTEPAERTVVQQPAPTGEAEEWLATSPPRERPQARTPAERQPDRRFSAVLHKDSGTSASGLVIDSWAEVVPRAAGANGPEEIVGVAFDFDRPGARAPQALVVAVPPDLARGWCMEDVHACVEELLLLTRIRTLDLADLPELGPVLPIPQEIS